MKNQHFSVTTSIDPHSGKQITKIEYWEYNSVGERINIFVRYVTRGIR